MIRFDLTVAETDLLVEWLSQTFAAHARQAEGTPDQHALLTKLTAIQQMATSQAQCPLCRQPFVQHKDGRTGKYCSAACKQKAYRLRRNNARKQFGPPRKR